MAKPSRRGRSPKRSSLGARDGQDMSPSNLEDLRQLELDLMESALSRRARYLDMSPQTFVRRTKSTQDLCSQRKQSRKVPDKARKEDKKVYKKVGRSRSRGKKVLSDTESDSVSESESESESEGAKRRRGGSGRHKSSRPLKASKTSRTHKADSDSEISKKRSASERKAKEGASRRASRPLNEKLSPEEETALRNPKQLQEPSKRRANVKVPTEQVDEKETSKTPNAKARRPSPVRISSSTFSDQRTPKGMRQQHARFHDVEKLSLDDLHEKKNEKEPHSERAPLKAPATLSSVAPRKSSKSTAKIEQNSVLQQQQQRTGKHKNGPGITNSPSSSSSSSDEDEEEEENDFISELPDESGSESDSSSDGESKGFLNSVFPMRWRRRLRRASEWAWHLFPFFIILTLTLRSSSRSALVPPGIEPSQVETVRSDGSVRLRNLTTLLPDGVQRFYNGSIRFPNGTYMHLKEVSYADLGECSAFRVSQATKRAVEAYLNYHAAPQEHEQASKAPPLERKHCGIPGEKMFSTRSGMLSSQAPILFPRNDSQVQQFVRMIGDAGCKIRPVGAGQSESGISINPIDDLSVGISLAKYRADPGSSWALANLASAKQLMDSQGRVRAEAGHTLLKVNSVTRPRHWHFATLPNNWAITVGAAATSMVHGAGFGKSFLSASVTRMRVVLGDGTIEELSEPLDLAMWRNSMGLIGLVLGVEFQLEYRPFFSMGSRQTVIHQWSPWYLDHAVSALLPGADGAEYLFDPWSDELVGVGYTSKNPKASRLMQHMNINYPNQQFTSDKDCTFDVGRFACNFPEFCEYRFQIGDYLPGQSCRLRRKPNPSTKQILSTYEELHSLMDDAAVFGLPSLQHTSELHWWDQEAQKSSKMHASGQDDAQDNDVRSPWVGNLAAAVNDARERLNDGFWMMAGDKTLSLNYLFPVSKLFEALDILRSLARELVIKNAPFQFRDAPVHFRFVRMEKSQVLQPKGAFSGDYVSIEVLVSIQCDRRSETHARTTSRCADSSPWRFALLELERRWIQVFKNDVFFPNLGGVYGFHVFQTKAKSRADTLKFKLRRIRRIKSAFERLKASYLARYAETPGGGGFKMFGGGVTSFEEATGIEDSTTAMLEQVQAEFFEKVQTDEEFNGLTKLFQEAMKEIELEEEHFGDLEQELVREAYRDESGPGGDEYYTTSAKTSESLPIPFSSSTLMHSMFPREAATAFLRYRQQLDPENRFWGGGAVRFFSKADKTAASMKADPDQMEEDFLILRMKQVEEQIKFEQESRRNLTIWALFVALSGVVLYQLARTLCSGRRRKKRSLSDSSESDYSSSSSDSSDSDSESDTSSDSEGSTSKPALVGKDESKSQGSEGT